MMFARDIKNTAGDTPVIIRQSINQAANPVTNDEVEDMIINNDPNYNLGAATRMPMLQGDRRQFSCAIPLHHIFGFCRNVRNVLYEAKHTVGLTQKGADDDAIWRIPADPAHPANDPGKVNFKKIILWMPVMTPSLTIVDRLLSFMNQGGK